jgi:dTDP-4-dehydrorhamnose 3,5-epimerase
MTLWKRRLCHARPLFLLADIRVREGGPNAISILSLMIPVDTIEAPPASTGHEARLVAGTVIRGVELRRLKMNYDRRGCFTEAFQENWKTCIKPVQWSVVHSQANVFRGLHMHRDHAEYIAVLSGQASVGLRDLRPWSPTKGAWSLYELNGASLACLTFPPGLLHGWYFSEASVHLQAVSESYADYGASDNWGCHWADPALEIPWPFTKPILAQRASHFPSLKILVDTLGDWGPPRAAQ